MAGFTYRVLQRLGMNYSESEYGDVTLCTVFKKVFVTFRNSILLGWVMNSVLLSPILPRLLRPRILKWIGCSVGKNVFIGADVRIDSGHAGLIVLEDRVHIAAYSILLCHQRDLSNYKVGDDYSKLGYKLGKITLKKRWLKE